MDLISIPYGAIKRFQLSEVWLPQQHISIPYGAIKRKTEKKYDLFEFISIPYGAIKRP